jgi:hypothetical protein
MRNTTGDERDGAPSVPRRSGEAGLYTVPRLEELAADPRKAGVLDARTARIVAAKALGVFAASLYRLLEAEDPNDGNRDGTPAWQDGPASGSRILPSLADVASVEEVAKIIGKPRRWIIRNAATLPFVMRVSRKHFVCSRIALRRWLSTRRRSMDRA